MRLTDAPPEVERRVRYMPRSDRRSSAALEFSHMKLIRSMLPRLWPPTNVSLANSSTLSSMPSSACTFVQQAFMPPSAHTVLPPATDIFSSRMTFAPASWELMAAVMPAPPAPMTTISNVPPSISELCSLFGAQPVRPAKESIPSMPAPNAPLTNERRFTTTLPRL